MAADHASRTRRSIRRALLGGAGVAALLVAGLGGWAATAELAGAVIAPGALVVESSVKKVQHPTGGVVGELRVRDGDSVRAGDIVMRLDETIVRANYALISKSIDEFAVRQARLKAEQEGLKEVRYEPELAARRSELQALMADEDRLLATRISAREGQKQQLRERVQQLREQISGMNDQIGAKRREIELIQQELQGVRDLWRKNLVPITRVTALERDAARLEGERGALIANVAQTKGRISETELQILQIDQDMRAEVGRELAEIRARLSELSEKRVSAQDQLKRIDIRAPQDGVVHQLAVHTVGGVVTPSEPLMLIVPRADDLSVEARIAPQDIDHVRVGQPALLRFSAFNQRTTPEINGEVAMVSADVSEEQRTGTRYYTVRIAFTAQELSRLGQVRLAPGMPVESFIKTDERTVISYLAKPLMDQLARAFRER